MKSKQSILLIYTGGTIGMMEDPESGSLVPFDFAQLRVHVPELRRFDCNIEAVSFDQPIDSSDVNIDSWQRMADMVEVNYNHYDGFVILHGTDTMAFSASALSFMLENVAKPVIFTGSQLPIGQIRTDGKENLITAIEIASDTENGYPIVQEVCVLFQSKLFRGNRTHKYSTENFDAFESANLPALAEIGIHIHYRHDLLLRPQGPLTIRKAFSDQVGIIKIFPGISKPYVEGVLALPGIKAFVLETFGAGNGPTDVWFLNALRNATSKGIIILNVTQCNKGMVEQGLYETSSAFEEIGIISGGDMTTEAALVKLMYLLGLNYNPTDMKRILLESISGERNSE
jgi:L-asparaginase